MPLSNKHAIIYDRIKIQPEINALQGNFGNEDSVQVSMLRLDKIHPVISGNKLFKLRYFLEEANNSTHKTIITFGGAYSNHLAATAFACKAEGIRCVGIVRGDESPSLSPTLRFCIENGMQLAFVSRDTYRNIDDKFREGLLSKYGHHTLMPEGGFAIKGAKGAEDIMKLFNEEDYSHICCPVGTATTLGGLINGSDNYTCILGFNVLKNLNDIEERLKKLNVTRAVMCKIIDDYHFGGYAKKNPALIKFMNDFYTENGIPLDFVYTGKMMFGVSELVKGNYFPAGSRILCIHTGGLQGNSSLPSGMLHF
ncbi:MAG: pyridoxal-phosphate dependent enzyme [Ginsengibacter sp.]